VTGARISELIGLDAGDVDFDDGVLVITYSKFNNYAELVVMPSRAPGTLVRRCARPEILGITASSRMRVPFSGVPRRPGRGMTNVQTCVRSADRPAAAIRRWF
jgi:integrase